MLLALGCTLWLAGTLAFLYSERVLLSGTYVSYPIDLLFFIHIVPFMAALAVMPHARKMQETLRFGLLDFLLFSILWDLRIHFSRQCLGKLFRRT